MGYNRPGSKMLTRQSMHGTFPNPVMVTLVYFLLTTVLASAVTMMVSNPFQIAWLYIMEGKYALEDILRAVFVPSKVVLFAVLQVVLALYQALMGYGYFSYSLRMVRWEQPGYRNLGDGFFRPGRVLLVRILTAVFVGLWLILGNIPSLVFLIIGGATGSETLITMSSVLALPGSLLGICASYKYRLAYFVMIDNPSFGALKAIRSSKELMMGRRLELFEQDLSFLLWILLESITFGIASVWVTPYMTGTEAIFYYYAVHGRYPEQPAPRVNEFGYRF